MNMLQSCVHPTVSKHVKQLYSFLREYRDEKNSWSQMKAKTFNVFNKYVRNQIPRNTADVKKKQKKAAYLFSAPCILHLLAYCSPQTEDSVGFRIFLFLIITFFNFFRKIKGFQ
jgi:hypothetical protein